ncbi:hypothetical protein ABT299_49785 [Spirillospora sp. NPDC000708]|uniref:hypothetical protein n=1 Tax=Actinomadura TaxID=1988 RepID=UPI001689172A|nr:hypothetical protein [Actinomadura sp. RB99]MBD2900404.1 hypothetical protein [Actinomadura sp. RB99]
MIDVSLTAVFAVLGAGALATVLISALLGWVIRPRGGGPAAPAGGVHGRRADERQPVS